MRRLELFVAEDSDADLYWLRMVLREMGLEVALRLVCDGETARDYLLKRGNYRDVQDPELILLDLNLPRLTGIEVLRALPQPVRMPICILTSSSMEREFIERHFGLNGLAYIVKPVTREKLLACLQVYEHLKPISDELAGHRGAMAG
jgi:chemotaxis family two-component system response regulator Rcp1